MMHAENCQRCQKPTNGVTIMSMFNTQVICMDCKKTEKENPRYAEAVEKDIQEIKKGNYNFEGIVNVINNELALVGGNFAFIIGKSGDG